MNYHAPQWSIRLGVKDPRTTLQPVVVKVRERENDDAEEEDVVVLVDVLVDSAGCHRSSGAHVCHISTDARFSHFMA
jgi:hypothetical protein